MESLLNIITALSGALIVMVLVSLRRAHIRVEYSVSWLAAAVLLLLLSRAHSLLNWLAEALGVQYPPLVIFLIASCTFLLVFYRFSVIISNLRDNNIALAQKVAILEYQIRNYYEERQTQSGR